MKPNLIAFAGSARKASLNRRLIQFAATAASKAGAEVDLIDLKDYPLPLFDQDLEDEKGMPERAHQLKQRFAAAQGLLIASPEYNSSFSPLMKNVIDWMSRSESDDEPPCAVFRGKPAGLMAASPGGIGGMRGLFQLRAVLQNIGVMVMPGMASVGGAMEVLSETGQISDPSLEKRVVAVADSLVELTTKLTA